MKRIVQLVTQARGGPVDHAVDVACRLSELGHDSHVVGPLDGYRDRLEAAGAGCHAVAMPAKTDLRGARRLGETLRALRPDVLHCQDMRAGLVGRLLSRRQPVGGLVYTVHGVPDGLSARVAGNAQVAPQRRRDVLYYIAGERLLARLAPAQVVVPCAAVGRYVRDHLRLAPERVRVVHNGVDTARFRPVAQRAGSTLTAVWLGVMNPVKRVPDLVRALAGAPDVRLHLVGSGVTHDEIVATVRALNVPDRVTITDFVDDPVRVLNAGDVFVLPSAAEAFPLAALQAMACGLPIVATRVGGVSELVRDGVDGLLVPADDPGALAHALNRVATDRAGRLAMGRSARERVVETFSLDACVTALLDVYEDAR